MLFSLRSLPKSKRSRKLRFDSLESREVPAAPGLDVTPPLTEKIRVDAPPTLSTPEMPALASMSPGMVGAIQNMWKLPIGTQTDRWVIQLPDGRLPFALSAIGAVSLQDVPYWANSYVVNFSSPVDVENFPTALSGVTEAEFYYPLISRMLEKKFVPNDTLFSGQWHLRNTGQNGGTPGADANIVLAWDELDGGGQPVRGAGVVIGVVDDGLQRVHPDLVANYSALHSYDFNDSDLDPTPSAGDGHGTSVAGVAAGRGSNNLGISGAAPQATLAGLRILGGSIDDSIEAAALGYHPDDIDIYSNSWGPADNGTLGFIGPMALAQLQTGTTSGRSGLGSIYTWAAGNGLGSNDNVNYDSYANSRFVIAVGAIDHSGVQSYYSEPGAAMLVTAYSDGSVSGITTTDLMGSDGYNGLSDQNYTNGFGGTSSATPLVSGVIALMLDANPSLSYRDVQHILVKSAEKNSPGDAGWSNNGAGLHVNHKFGFGAIDALAAVTLAKTWSAVPTQISFSSPVQNVNAAIAEYPGTGLTRTFNMTQDMRLEHVELVMNVTHTYIGDLNITLTSPSGTQSIMSTTHTDTSEAFDDWVFSTVRNWDESPMGMWTVKIFDGANVDIGNWNSYSLNFYGTPAIDPPILASIESTIIDYVTLQGQLPITQAVTLVDTDSTSMGSATVTIASNYIAAQDFLRFTNQNGITGSFSAGVLTLNGPATTAQYQTALRSVAYENTSPTPSTLQRRVDFRVTDFGGAVSNIVLRRINIVTTNNTPTLNTLTNPAALNEDGTQSKALSGISAGGETQDLTVTATSDNPGLIPIVNVVYTSPNATGSVNYSPLPDQFGTAVITVKVKDSGGAEITRTFTVTVNSVNDTPSFTKGVDLNVILDAPAQTFPNWATAINPGAANESGQVLTFVVTPANTGLFLVQPAIDSSGTLTFTPLIGAAGFTTIDVRLQDNGGGAFQSPVQTFTINIEANDAPVLDNAIATRFTAIPRGTANPLGDTIATLVGSTITDPDPLPFEGVAVVGLTGLANGTWEYSLDAGASWTPFGLVSTSAARLLRATDMARFVPDPLAPTIVGTPRMTYHAWDQSAGLFGDVVDLEPPASTTGLDTAYSINSTIAGLRVAMTMTPLLEDPKTNKGDQVFALTATLVTDNDLKSKRGMAVTGLASTTLGTWEYTVAGKFVPIGSVSPSNALLLGDKDRIRFVPKTNQSGQAKFLFHAWDQTNGVKGARKDISALNAVGGGTAFSSVEDTLFVQVLPANDQPVLALGPNVRLTPVPIGTAEPTGNTVAQILGGMMTDGDSTDPRGVGIVGVINTGGTWQYRLNATVFWVDIPVVSTKSAFLLGDLDSIRFRPQSSFSGTATFKFKAWDRSAGGVIGFSLDPTRNLSFSLATQTAKVLISDAPRLENTAPQLNNATFPRLSTYVEDGRVAGDLVSSLLLGNSVMDGNFGDPQGIVVKGATATAAGVWQYNVGAGWKSMADASPALALYLRDTDKIRFLPTKDANGLAILTFHAWDRTQGLAGQRTDLTKPGATGSTSAVSFLFDTCTIDVVAVNDAPALNVERMFLFTEIAPMLPTDPEPAGDLVASLLGTAISDVDVGGLRGIAITKIDTTLGAWQYQLNGTPNWVPISNVSNANALLVRDIDRIHFYPLSGIEAKPLLSFKAWDQEDGTVGSYVNTTVDTVDILAPQNTILRTSFSKAIGTAMATVNAVNDRPILYPKVAARLEPVLTNDTNSPGTLVGNLLSYSAIDPDAGALRGIAVVTIDIKKGTWQFSSDGGANWLPVDLVSTKSALLLRAQYLIRFVPTVPGFVGTAKLTYHAWDQTFGTAGTKVNPLTVGATAFSVAKATSIVNVNTAPNIDA
ncbi:MAG: hypothetical protein EXS09_19305 [Gemmataceae bacterium]|nr:hypothetical protein [Gemmataceae bacterium]